MQEHELMEYKPAFGVNGNGEYTKGVEQVFRKEGKGMMDIMEVKAKLNELRLRHSVEYTEVQEIVSAIRNSLSVLGEEVVLAVIKQVDDILKDKVIVFTTGDLESEEETEFESVRTAKELYRQVVFNPIARLAYKDKRVWTEEELREAIESVRSLSGGLTREDVEKILQEVLQDKIEEIRGLFSESIEEIRQRLGLLEERVESRQEGYENYAGYDSSELEGIRQEIMLLQNRLMALEEQGIANREVFMQLQDLQNKVEVLFSSLGSVGQTSKEEIEEIVRREILGHIASIEERLQNLSTQKKEEPTTQTWETPTSGEEEEEGEKIGSLYEEEEKAKTKKKKGFVESLLEDPKIKYGLIGLLGFIALWLLLRLL